MRKYIYGLLIYFIFICNSHSGVLSDVVRDVISDVVQNAVFIETSTDENGLLLENGVNLNLLLETDQNLLLE